VGDGLAEPDLIMAFEQTALLWRNVVPASTMSGGSWSLPLTNLQTSELAAVARSITDSTADTKIRIDHGSAVTARVIWLAGHNLSSAATWRVLRGTTAGGSDVYAGTLANAWSIAPPTFDGTVYGACIVMPAANSARYTTIEIEDTSNPAGYVQAGQLLIGDVLTFTRGPSVGLQHGIRDLSTITEAESGATWATVRRKQRGVSFVLDALEDPETDALQDLLMHVGTHGQAVYLPSLFDAAANQRYGFLGRMAELSAIEYPYARYRSLPIKMTEWL
jgi:hypothetical protein